MGSDREDFLEGFLANCGLEVQNGKAMKISVDRREFQKKVLASLVKRELTSAAIVDEIRKYLQKSPERFNNALLTCETSSDADSQVTLWPSRQNSILCLILGVTQIQKDLLKLVFDIAYERVLAEENASAVIFGVVQAVKWQDSICEPRLLTDRLFEMVEDFPPQSQCQLIKALPDLLFDEYSQTQASSKLCELYESRSELAGAALEALGAIRVPEDQISEVRKSVLSSIPNLDISQLCPVLDFTLRNLPDAEAPIVINLLRCSDAITLAVDNSREQDGSDESAGSSALSDDLQRFVEKLRVGVMTHKVVAERWLKIIEVSSTGCALKTLDVIFIFACYRQLPTRHVELTLRQVIKCESLTESLITGILTKFKNLLKRYISNIIDICETLLRSAVVSVHEFASTVYKQLFLNYDAQVQTDVIVSLLTHAGSGSPSELQNSLTCVESLCTDHALRTAPFGFMLQTLVDQISRLSLGQARTLFRSLASLAYVTSDSDSGLRDTLRIAARKRLVNPNLKYKCMGVVATVAVVEAMASKKSEGELTADVQGCLEQALESSRSFPVSAALFLDELSLAVPRLREDLVKWIHSWATIEFQRSYVLNDSRDGGCSSSTSSANRASFSSPGLRIDIQKLCLLQDRSAGCGMPIDAMCPLFRLLRTCEVTCFSSDLQGITALLFAKTLPADLDDLNFQMAPDKDSLLTALFHTINWHRELLNCASNKMSEEVKNQLVLILKRQVRLIDLAASWLPYLPTFVPPRVGFEDESSAQGVHVKKAVQTKPARGRKRKAPSQEDEEIAATKVSPPPVSSSSFRHSLRAPDLYFMLLIDDDFSPKELAFALQELLLQLESSLALDEPQRTSFLPTAARRDIVAFRRPPVEVIHFVVDLLPKLTAFIENIASKIQGNAENLEDSILETENVDCLRLCFSILNSLLSWRGFNELRYSKILRDALNLIALRVGNTQFRTQCDLVEFHKRVFNYFVELSPSIDNLHTAAAFVRLLLTVLDKTASNADANKKRLLGVAEDFLRKDWPKTGLENRVVSKCTRTLLTVYIEESEDRLAQIGFLVSTVLPELSGSNRSATFPLVSKETIGPCLKTISSYFSKCVKLSCGFSATGNLDAWLVVAQRLREFLDVIKVAATNTNASCGLKMACEVLDSFVKHGIPVLEAEFKSRNDDVLRLVKTLQHSTRIMQHTCSHFKMSQQVALGRQVPIARKLLELFIFKMKALFNKFGCGDALQMGQLKMRNLKGESMDIQTDSDEIDEESAISENEVEDDEEVAYNLTDQSAEF